MYAHTCTQSTHIQTQTCPHERAPTQLTSHALPAVFQPREKQALVEQLQYRLSAETGRQGALVASVRHRVSELEVELTEARKEADEYHRVNIEGNLQLTTLSNEVANLITI